MELADVLPGFQVPYRAFAREYLIVEMDCLYGDMHLCSMRVRVDVSLCIGKGKDLFNPRRMIFLSTSPVMALLQVSSSHKNCQIVNCCLKIDSSQLSGCKIRCG